MTLKCPIASFDRPAVDHQRKHKVETTAGFELMNKGVKRKSGLCEHVKATN